MRRSASCTRSAARSRCSSPATGSWSARSRPTGVTRPPRTGTRRSRGRRSAAGSSPTPRTACSRSTSTSTRPTRTWPRFPTRSPTTRRCTAPTCSRPASWGRRTATSPSAGPAPSSRRARAGRVRRSGARLGGAGLVIGVESVPRRQHLARAYGADEIVDFAQEDVIDRIFELTGGEGVDTAIEALGADRTFQTAVKITKPGGTISNTGYFGDGEFVRIPRVEWGVGMADKTIATGLCPGGRMRMERLLRVLAANRVNPTLMTTHTFDFDDMERAFEVSDRKLDDVVKPLIKF